jgi:hypothetical protein
LLVALLGMAAPAQSGQGASGEQGAGQAAGAASSLTLAAGTKIEVTLVRPLPAKTAKAGDALYGQTNYPVAVGDRIAIPAGTWVMGRVESVTPPSRRHDQAQVDVLFTKIIFANGYVVTLPGAGMDAGAAVPPDAVEMRVTVQVSAANDLLLDNGAQMEMALAAPVTLDAAQVTQAAARTHAPSPGSLRSATLCRPTEGSPGSSDTVIPGTPGTPDTVIPGGPGMPDTVIPGTPSTPDTVIPGTPGTPGSVCPAAPVVVSSVAVPRAGARTSTGTDPH